MTGTKFSTPGNPGGDNRTTMEIQCSKRVDTWLWAILALGLGLRLFWLDQPLIDLQAWRQADTAAMARNFYTEEYNPLYPRVDWRGTTPGYVETNFPLFPFLVACAYSIAGGAEEWIGRLLAALFSTAGAALLYRLARRLCADLWTARLSALLLLIFPLNIYLGRAFMPEALMLLLSIGSLLAFDYYAAKGGAAPFMLAWTTAALCFLVKIPTLYLGFPLVALAWTHWGWDFLRRPALWAYLILALLPAMLWYWHAYGLFEQTGLTFGIWNRYGYDKWSNQLLWEGDFYLEMLRRFGHSVFTPAGFALVVLGLLRAGGERYARVVTIWMGALLLYLFLIPEGNHRLHYYQLPFIVPGALLAGDMLARLLRGETAAARWLQWPTRCSSRQRVALVVLIATGIGSYGIWAIQDFYQPPKIYRFYQDSLAAGRALDRKLPPDVRLVVGDIDENTTELFRSQSPTMLYYCRRKGWQITLKEFSGTRLDSLAALGADYFLVGGGFARPDSAFWQELLRRGITIPSEYPRFWTDEALFDRMWRGHREPDRHFILTRLQTP